MNDLGTAMDAIHAWAEAQTGLTVIWADDGAPRPAVPFGVLRRVSGPSPVGSIDELRLDTDLGQPAGEEVGQTVVGQRSMVVSFQVLARRDLEVAYDPTAAAVALLARAGASARLPTVRDSLWAAGVAVLAVSPIQNLTGLEADKDFNERAQMDVTFGLAIEASERTGYIDDALVTSTLGVSGSVELNDDPLGG